MSDSKLVSFVPMVGANTPAGTVCRFKDRSMQDTWEPFGHPSFHERHIENFDFAREKPSKLEPKIKPAKPSSTSSIHRDERGRVIGADGYPTCGLAKISEAMSLSGLSRSKIYDMVSRGQLESRRFGKSRRITWESLRAVFMDGATGGNSNE